MKKTLLALAVGVAMSTSAVAGQMYLNLGTNAYDMDLGTVTNADANFTTANFTSFGFTDMWATSVYAFDLQSQSMTGSFYDTNKTAELNNLSGMGTTGPSIGEMVGILPTSTPDVTLQLPAANGSQSNFDALSPLSPPIDSDDEGYNLTWRLMTEYHFDGVLTAGGPVYTGGTFDIYFDDLSGTTGDFLALSGKLTGSDLQVANLSLFMDITYAADDFLFIDANGNGYFEDAADLATIDNPRELVLNTNVNPPVPTLDQLRLVYDSNTDGYAVARQASLSGTVTAVPEPGTLALAGLGLLGLGLARRRAKKAA